MPKISNQPKPEWASLPRAGCLNVEFRVLLNRDGLTVANLRFAQNANIDEHDAPMDIDAICVSGSGFVSVAGEVSELSAGQTVHWPANEMHKLWTTDTTMETIMVERVYQVGTQDG
ncbi:MAG: hypothetical protein GKR90_20025 [Pseudomonadales bacterium]|nr:hypothetical protein [Pseudomonadales bacterium]